MSTEDKLEGARNGLAFFYNFFNIVGQEIGVEKALEFSIKTDAIMGEAQGKMIKEQFGETEIDLNTATTMALDTIKEGFGINSEVLTKHQNRVVIRCSRCPAFEAAQGAGIDNKTIETLCRSGSMKFMDAMVKQLNPKLSYQLVEFRSGATECCEEEILLSIT